MDELSEEAYAILEGRHSDPFHYLGLHSQDGKTIMRAFLPGASSVDVVDRQRTLAHLDFIHPAGLFEGFLSTTPRRYQLRAQFGRDVVDLEDPYRFDPILTDLDLYLLAEGTDQRLYDKLGAHAKTIDGVAGVAFVVFAPNARRVSVVGDFNFWDTRRHPMRRRGAGYWELFVPHAAAGDRYKFDLIGPQDQRLPAQSRSARFRGGNAPQYGFCRV